MSGEFPTDQEVAGWRAPNSTEADETDLDTPTIDGTPEQLAEDFFARVQTDLETATTFTQLHEIATRVDGLLENNQISQPQYDSFILALEEKQVYVKEQEGEVYLGYIGRADTFSELQQWLGYAEGARDRDEILPNMFDEVMAVYETQLLKLQERQKDSYLGYIGRVDTFSELQQWLGYAEGARGRDEILPSMFDEVMTAYETRRSEIQ